MANDMLEFILHLKYDDLPKEAILCAKRNLIDTIATAAAGRKTPCAEITCKFAHSFYGASSENQAPILFDNRSASFPGAALAGAMMTDSFDAHDTSCPCKGHIGVAIFPALLTMVTQRPMAGKEFITASVIGYELSERAGRALHGTVADYHTSGAWNALGCAAIVARAIGLTAGQTREALGIAEYYGPRSQMMRCIAYPTMVKDGSGWGCMVGVSAALLAKDGFTGAPAITVEDQGVDHHYADLSKQWMVAEQSYKPYPVCYWAQPGLASLKKLMDSNPVDPQAVDFVEVQAFHNACCLNTSKPTTTEEAQYSAPFPLACCIMRGKVGVDEITEGFKDPQILAMAAKVKMVENANYEEQYKNSFCRWSHVVVHLKDGSKLVGPPMEPWGKPGSPAGMLTDEQLLAKAEDLLQSQLSLDETKELITGMQHLEEYDDVMDVFKVIFK